MRLSNAFIALCLLLGALQARAADVVVMRDGSERSGTLELCADEQCRLSGKRIPIEEIRAIFLDGPRKELPVRSSAIVMRDGSVRTGRVTFVNRGTVDTDDEGFDRSRVAAIIFSAAPQKPVSDLLILRNGSVKSGALTTCNAASCTLDGAITPLANIEWVGLAREDVIPPSSTADEVHKIDGTIIPGRLSGINESRVSTTRGPVLRAETAWVHLAPPAPTQPDQPGSFGAPPPASAPPGAAPPPAAPPPPPATPPPRNRPPRPRRSLENAVKPCPAGKPLGGHLEFRISATEEVRPRMSRSSRVRVWFGLAPMLPPTEWRYDLRQTWNASHMTWRTEASGCVDLPDAYGEVCTCPPARETGISSLSEGYGYAHFGPLYPELTLQLPSAIEHSSTVTFQCVDPRGDGVGGGIGTSISGVENVLSASAGTTDGAFFVAPTGCVGPDGRVTPDCSAHPELYAAIPFVGSDQRRVVSTSSSRQTKMRWEVCCGCGVPPRDMPEGETDPCGDPDQQRGLLEVAVDYAKALRAEARPHLQRFEREYGQAQQFKSDFDLVVNSCAGWDIAMALLAFLAGGPNAPQSAQAFTQGLGMLQQVLARDPSVVLSAGAAFGLEGWDVVNDSWGLMSTLYTGALDASSAGSLPGMKAKLEDCARVPLVSRLVYDDAKLYLQHLETAFTELRELHRLSTLAQQADTQVIEKWHAYHRACLENAACRGIDPAVCGPAPP